MTEQFNIFFNKILLELSQNLVQRAVQDNQFLASRNNYAKDRSERFYKKAINYAKKNNSAIKLNVIGEGEPKIINFIITKIKNPTGFTSEKDLRGPGSKRWQDDSLQIYGNIRNLEDSDKYQPSGTGELIMFNLNSGDYSFHSTYVPKRYYTLVDVEDAKAFTQKVKEQTGIIIPWKSLEFGNI